MRSKSLVHDDLHRPICLGRQQFVAFANDKAEFVSTAVACRNPAFRCLHVDLFDLRTAEHELLSGSRLLRTHDVQPVVPCRFPVLLVDGVQPAQAVVGRPLLYKTTPEFLESFGLRSLDDLPPMELEQGQPLELDLLTANLAAAQS